MKRKLLALLLALVLCLTVPLSVAADAYIPPEEPASSGYDILNAHKRNGTCKALNTFLSNFVEIALRSYHSATSDEDVIAAVLKHIELNAQYYSASMSKVTGDDGKTYMKVSESLFNKRMQALFGRDIPASHCPGYDNGYITVTADHYGGPIQVFASVYDVYAMGGGVYDVYFDVYFINKDFSGWYTTAHDNLPTENLSLLGSGNAVIQYDGGETEDSISTSDFGLLEYFMAAEGIPCQGANVPYGYVEETLPPETEAPTEPETEPETEAPAEEEDEVLPAPKEENKKEDMDEDEDEEEDDRKSSDRDRKNKISFSFDTQTILIIILVAAVVLFAVVVIAFIIVKKKQ